MVGLAVLHVESEPDTGYRFEYVDILDLYDSYGDGVDWNDSPMFRRFVVEAATQDFGNAAQILFPGEPGFENQFTWHSPNYRQKRRSLPPT